MQTWEKGSSRLGEAVENLSVQGGDLMISIILSYKNVTGTTSSCEVQKLLRVGRKTASHGS